MVTNRKSQIADRSVSVPMTLITLKGGTRGDQLFQLISVRTVVRVGIERPNSAW